MISVIDNSLLEELFWQFVNLNKEKHRLIEPYYRNDDKSEINVFQVPYIGTATFTPIHPITTLSGRGVRYDKPLEHKTREIGVYFSYSKSYFNLVYSDRVEGLPSIHLAPFDDVFPQLSDEHKKLICFNINLLRIK